MGGFPDFFLALAYCFLGLKGKPQPRQKEEAAEPTESPRRRCAASAGSAPAVCPERRLPRRDTHMFVPLPFCPIKTQTYSGAGRKVENGEGKKGYGEKGEGKKQVGAGNSKRNVWHAMPWLFSCFWLLKLFFASVARLRGFLS